MASALQSAWHQIDIITKQNQLCLMVNLWNIPHCFQELWESGNNGMPKQIDVNTQREEAFDPTVSDCWGCLSSLCEQKQKSWFWVRIWHIHSAHIKCTVGVLNHAYNDITIFHRQPIQILLRLIVYVNSTLVKGKWNDNKTKFKLHT